MASVHIFKSIEQACRGGGNGRKDSAQGCCGGGSGKGAKFFFLKPSSDSSALSFFFLAVRARDHQWQTFFSL